MAQVGKKNLTLFQALRKEKAVKVKAVGNTEVPNLQESLVEVHVHGVTKRKAELPARPGRGKDIKKVRAALLGQGLSNGAKGPEAGLIELPEMNVRKDIEITMPKKLNNSIDNMKLDHLVRTMVEFSSEALILGHRVGSLYRRELKEGNHDKLEELQGKVDKFAEEKATWEKEREEWKGEKKRLRTWKVGCLDSEEKFKGKIPDLEVDYDELKEKHEGLEVELEDLKSCIIQEHINGFQKRVKQAAFFCKDIDVADLRFDVNKEVVDEQLINEAESIPEEEVEKTMANENMNAGTIVGSDDNKAA